MLDGGVCTTVAFPLTLVKMVPKVENGFAEVVGPEQCKENEEEEEEEEEDEAIVDSEKMSWSTEEENVETSVAANIANGVLKVPPGFKEKEITGSLRNTPLLSMPTQGTKLHDYTVVFVCEFQESYNICSFFMLFYAQNIDHVSLLWLISRVPFSY